MRGAGAKWCGGRPCKQDGKLGVGVFPWGNHAKEEIRLNDKHVIYSSRPVDELLEMYENATGRSKIAVPPKNIVLNSK